MKWALASFILGVVLGATSHQTVEAPILEDPTWCYRQTFTTHEHLASYRAVHPDQYRTVFIRPIGTYTIEVYTLCEETPLPHLRHSFLLKNSPGGVSR